MSDTTMEMSGRVSALEARVEHELAAKEWVRATLQPVIDATARTEQSVAKLADSVSELTRDTKALYAAHDRLLEDRAAQEKAEHEQRLKMAKENTLCSLVKERWVPLLSFLALTLAVLTTLSGALVWWVNHYVIPAAR